jgi:hypothetical protein
MLPETSAITSHLSTHHLLATLPSNLRPREQAILCLSAPLLHPYQLSDETDVELGRDRRDEGAEYESKRDHCGSENRVRRIGIYDQRRRLPVNDLVRQTGRKAW